MKNKDIEKVIENLLGKKNTIEQELKEMNAPRSNTALILTARRDTIEDVFEALMEVYETNEEQ